MAAPGRSAAESSDELKPRARVGAGLACAALGLIPMLGAFDIGLVRREQINGPPWVGFVAGSVFFVAGLMLIAGERMEDPRVGYSLIFLLMAAFAAIGNWVAFGPGERVCEDGETGWACRGPFGIGALILDGLLVWSLCAALSRLLGPGPLATGVDRLGKAVLLLTLSPILLPLLLVVIAKAAFDAVRERLRTGRWPKNEAFLERMKLRSP